MCSLGEKNSLMQTGFHTLTCMHTSLYNQAKSVQHLFGGSDLWLFAVLARVLWVFSTHTSCPPIRSNTKAIHMHARTHTLWLYSLHANKQVCTHSKFNHRGLQLVMLVSVSIRLYRCSGGGLLDLSTIPQQDHKHRHKHTLSAANANLPKCVCICVYLCLCVVCNDVHYNSSSVPAMAHVETWSGWWKLARWWICLWKKGFWIESCSELFCLNTLTCALFCVYVFLIIIA